MGMAEVIKEHEMVALLVDMPDDQLVRGDVGTVVFVHKNAEAFEVEFLNPAGNPRYVVVTVMAGDLLKLRGLVSGCRA